MSSESPKGKVLLFSTWQIVPLLRRQEKKRRRKGKEETRLDRPLKLALPQVNILSVGGQCQGVVGFGACRSAELYAPTILYVAAPEIMLTN